MQFYMEYEVMRCKTIYVKVMRIGVIHTLFRYNIYIYVLVRVVRHSNYFRPLMLTYWMSFIKDICLLNSKPTKILKTIRGENLSSTKTIS